MAIWANRLMGLTRRRRRSRTKAIAARWRATCGQLGGFVNWVVTAFGAVGLRLLCAAELSTRLSAVGPHEIGSDDDGAVITAGGVVGFATWSRLRPPRSRGPAFRCRSLGADAGRVEAAHVAPQASDGPFGLAGCSESRCWHPQGPPPSRGALGANAGGKPRTMLRLLRMGHSRARLGHAARAAGLGSFETSFTQIRARRRAVAWKVSSLL